MSLTATPFDRIKYEMGLATINLSSDSLKIILMGSGYTFNKGTQHVYSDVVANEVATAYGYTQNTKVLTTPIWAEDDTNHWGIFSCDNVTWTASGGSITAIGAVIFDDTPATKHLVGYLDFGGSQSAASGQTFQISNIVLKLS